MAEHYAAPNGKDGLDSYGPSCRHLTVIEDIGTSWFSRSRWFFDLGDSPPLLLSQRTSEVSSLQVLPV